MKKLVGKCGFVCEICPAYSKNIMHDSDRVEISKKWMQIFNFSINPEDIKCNGCTSIIGEGHELLHSDCEFRKCTDEKKVKNCSECDTYMCKNLENYISAYEGVARDPMISKEDIFKYLKPHMEARNSLIKEKKNE